MMHHRPGNAGASDRLDRAERRPEKVVSLSGRLGHLAKRFLGEGRGNIAVTFALAIAVVLGAVGLGTDAATWYATRRAMQNASDLGAEAAINSLKINMSTASSTTDGYAASEATSTTATHAFPNSGTTTVTVNIPPLHGSHTGSAYNHLAAEVIISQPGPGFFSSIFNSAGTTISTRSVAVINTSLGDCMLALNPTADKSLNFQGATAITVPCGMAAASTSSDAIDATGGAATVNATGGVRTAGGVVDTHNTINGTITQNGGAISDPYGSRILPTLAPGHSGSSDANKLLTVTPTSSYNGNITSTTDSSTLFSGGCATGCVINGNIDLSGGGNPTLTLSSGLYFINSGGSTSNGNITLGAHGSIISNGATIILTSSTGTNVGTFKMTNAQATVNMLAPSNVNTTDPGHDLTQTYPGLAGLALIQDRLAATSVPAVSSNGSCNSPNTNSFYGGALSTFNGAIYMPKGCMQWQGNPVTTACFQLITDVLTINGNPNINVSGCNQGEERFGPATVALVE